MSKVIDILKEIGLFIVGSILMLGSCLVSFIFEVMILVTAILAIMWLFGFLSN